MANNVQQFQAGNSSPHHCKECGLYMNSAESLDVHLQYHKENLLNKWATQATSSQEETNNNVGKNVKFMGSTIAAAADSSDAMIKKSPEYGSRATPENNFGHPPTPQSYHSASSPYQTPDNSAFSPGFQNFPIKQERSTSPNHYQNFQFQENQFFPMENQPQQSYMQQNSFRYHPYHYERNTQVTSSSPAYPPQPTPSPSPKQCDKCGYVCESASQLIDHINVTHPPTPAPHLNYQNSHFIFNNQNAEIKTEDDAQSEILDLDSHKVVHQVYQDDDKREINNGVNHNPHSVSAMLTQWPQVQVPIQQQQQPPQQQNKLFNERGMFINNDSNGKIFDQQKIFQPHQEFLSGVNVSTTSNESYRGFEHLPQQNLISNQVTQVATPPSTKSSNWKSNEARRPKTYNCTACNKWFTSSGHLKRHYNTTLHKNAVKSSGQPDPASLPISAHHHPARESSSNREDQSNSPTEDSRSEDSMSNSFERPGPLPGLLQQPPAGPYDRVSMQNIHHGMGHQANHPASPPNGEAGPSINNPRGLLSISSTPGQNGFNLPPPPMMDNSQYQMYPNECAPHVTQVTATNSHNTIGEFQTHQELLTTNNNQPLPSFAQFNNRYGLILEHSGANVGGPGPVTAPYSYYTSDTDGNIYRQEDEYKLVVLTVGDESLLAPYSPPNHNNNNERKINIVEDLKIKFETQPASPEKAHIKRDYEESTGSPRITSTSQVNKDGIHRCYDCDKIFNKSCYLTQHNKTFHSGDKPFKCTRCGKRFSCDDQYQEHLSKHAGEKPHKCDLCPKQFNHKTDLRRHMCLHTGQKPYACETCGKGFIRKDHMLKHCETHTKKPHSKIMQAAR